MRAIILADAEAELENAFNYYQAQREGLGVDLVLEFRRGLEQILRHPGAWQKLDETFRRYRIRRFPFAIIYKALHNDGVIVIETFAHLSRKPR